MTWTELPNDIESYLRNVRVHNVGEKDAVLYFNSIPYIIRAGETTSVPYEVVVLWLGDPRSGTNPQVITFHGEKTWIPTREQEVTRLRQQYGMHNIGGEGDILAAVDPDTDQLMDYPRIEVTDAQGTKLWTVLEDTTGEKAGYLLPNPHTQKVLNDRDQVLERMEREIAMLREQVNRQDAGFDRGSHTYTPTAESDLPVDEAPDPSVAPLPQRPHDNLDWGSTEDA